MTERFKIERIQGISVSEFQQLIETILRKNGLAEIESPQDDCIIATQQGAFSPLRLIFPLFKERLSSITEDKAVMLTDQIKSLSSQYHSVSIHIVSVFPISKGVKFKLDRNCKPLQLTYIDRDRLISLIDTVFPDYWRHDDRNLIQYENDFKLFVEEDTNLRKYSFSTDKYKERLNFFIEPQLTRRYEDKRTGTLVRKRFNVDRLVETSEPLIIDGMNGAGKSSILKRIGLLLIESNSTLRADKKAVPVFLTSQEIFKSSIRDLILLKLKSLIGDGSLQDVSENYELHILVDSIDELEEEQGTILNELSRLNKTYHFRYYLATRNYEALPSVNTATLPVYHIKRFNIEQIKKFLGAFFMNDEGKTNTLLEALRENKIIERLPITPLTLSLITILFEEKDIEIPATISDVYDNFNSLIVGQAIVSSKIELIEVSFRERILSVYALLLMETSNHEPQTEDDFIKYFVSFFADKSYTIKGGTIEDALHYLVHNTGILFLKDHKYVQFCHDSYMEYYAAREIFNHIRSKEDLLVKNFYDSNWQNAAIFYAGMSKDMPEFLNKILNKVRNSDTLQQYFSGILGCGYLLQSLYTTDNKIRKDVVIEALRMSLDALVLMKKIATDNPETYRIYKLPLLTILDFLYFYESFNSVTLSDPLKMAFEELYSKFEAIPPTVPISTYGGLGFSLFEIAFTLDSKRINDVTGLRKLIDNKRLLDDPNLCLLADFSLSNLNKNNYPQLKEQLRKKIESCSSAQRILLGMPIYKLRFTPLDSINPYTRVKLIVEGNTDARILEHAFMVLTGGHKPYWSIQPGGPAKDKSCAKGVRSAVEYSYSLVSNDEIVIGIVDHDAAGLREFNYLNKDFDIITDNCVKKHKDANIYILILPIPGEMDIYLQERQEFNFFEIEHYFGHEFLQKSKILKETPLKGVYDIIGGAKSEFSNNICHNNNPDDFKFFMELFQIIDRLVGVDVHYVI